MPTHVRIDDPQFTRGVAYGLAAALIWGAWPVFSRLGVTQALGAADITALRFGVSGLILLPLVLRKGTGGLGWARACVLAAGAGVPYVLVCIGGLTFAPAAHAGVITPSAMLVFSTLGGWLWLGDRPARHRMLGLGLIQGGVGMFGGRVPSGGGDQAWIGDLLFVTGGCLWAGYTVAVRRWAVDALQATALVSVISMALYLPVYLTFNPTALMGAPLTETLFQGVFQGVFAAILALLAYTRAVACLGAARGALFAALVPAVATLLAAPVLSEVPTATEWAGTAAVTAGMVWALSPGRGARIQES